MTDELNRAVFLMVVQAAADVYAVNPEAVLSPRGTHDSLQLSDCRQAVCWALHARGHTLSQIGRALDRDHSTVSHATRRAPEKAQKNRQIRQAYEAALLVLDPTAPVEPTTAKALRNHLFTMEALAQATIEAHRLAGAKAEALLSHVQTLLLSLEDPEYRRRLEPVPTRVRPGVALVRATAG